VVGDRRGVTPELVGQFGDRGAPQPRERVEDDGRRVVVERRRQFDVARVGGVEPALATHLRPRQQVLALEDADVVTDR